MFSTAKLGVSKDYQTRRKTVTVQFTDNLTGQTFPKDFSFSLEIPALEQKKAIKAYQDEINANTEDIPDGDFDFSDLVEVAVVETPEVIVNRTAQEIFVDLWQKLQAQKKLKAHGVVWLDAIQEADLIDKVTKKMKNSYQSII
jgi:hypothetical protein